MHKQLKAMAALGADFGLLVGPGRRRKIPSTAIDIALEPDASMLTHAVTTCRTCGSWTMKTARLSRGHQASDFIK